MWAKVNHYSCISTLFVILLGALLLLYFLFVMVLPQHPHIYFRATTTGRGYFSIFLFSSYGTKSGFRGSSHLAGQSKGEGNLAI